MKVQKPEDKPPPDTKVRIANVVVRRVKESQGMIGTLKIKPDSIKPLGKIDGNTKEMTHIPSRKRVISFYVSIASRIILKWGLFINDLNLYFWKSQNSLKHKQKV